MVTIKDVAKRAGVAVSTVSRVLNNLDRVSISTREKVLKVIEESNYVRNNFAASVKTGLSNLIVVVVPDIINEFYSSVIQGVEAVAGRSGYFTLVYATGEEGRKEKEFFDGAFMHMVDGIIIIPSIASKVSYNNVTKPIVIIDRKTTENETCSVTVNNYQGSKLLTEHLVEYGHRRIAIVTGSGVFNVGIDRMRGYHEVLNKNKIPIRSEFICSGSWYEKDGYQFAKHLLNLSNPPTAILAANNLLCLGCAEYMLDNKIQIGKDVSLVGFDDSEVLKYIGPGITAIRRPTTVMGNIGAQMLFEMLEDIEGKKIKKNIVLDVELIQRNSVAKINDLCPTS